MNDNAMIDKPAADRDMKTRDVRAARENLRRPFEVPEECPPFASEKAKELWPKIYAAIRSLKAECGYKIVAKILQRMESTIMIDGVCSRIVAELPTVRFLTIHDAALAVAHAADTVQQIMSEEFERRGVTPTIRRKTQKEHH